MSEVFGLVVTYERPAELRAMLTAIKSQTLIPSRIVVVDNGTRNRAEEVAQAHGCDYVASGGNLGPAGGIALGMAKILEFAKDDDWLMLFDDDDPPPLNEIVERLERFGREMRARDASTAGVGALGATYDRRLGIFRRVNDEELTGAVPVDVIHGGRFPLYRCGTLRRVGVFESGLFFGFEEGEFGLRLRQRGHALYLEGSLGLALRKAIGEFGPQLGQQRTPITKAAWRRYYGVRNSTILARRYASPLAPLIVAGGGALKGTLALTRIHRPIREVVLPLRGAIAGLAGRTGRPINPASSTKST